MKYSLSSCHSSGSYSVPRSLAHQASADSTLYTRRVAGPGLYSGWLPMLLILSASSNRVLTYILRYILNVYYYLFYTQIFSCHTISTFKIVRFVSFYFSKSFKILINLPYEENCDAKILLLMALK